MNISNSLMQAYRSYKRDEMCGIAFQEIYINKSVTTPTTDSQAAGQWFEFICTGALPRSGVEPQPEKTKSGEFTALYKALWQQRENFKEIYMDVENAKYGVTVEHEINGQNYKAIFDVTYPNTVRDIKTTGHIDNKWEKYGWENIEEKPMMEQAYFYVWIIWKMTGQIVNFFFDVFSTKNGNDCKTFEIILSREFLQAYENRLMNEVDMLLFDIATGFDVKPEMKRCKECPLFANCELKTLVPNIITIKK